MAARGSANWEAWWEARRGGASRAKTSRTGSAEGPHSRLQPVGVSLLKGYGDRDGSAAVQPLWVHISRSPTLHSSLFWRQGMHIGGGYKTKSKVATRLNTCTMVEKKKKINSMESGRTGSQ